MIGQTVSHYRITAKLGSGGMGVVYRATDTRLDRTVALKFLGSERLGDETAKTRFIQEARAASALEHPNICNIHEIDETPDGHLFIAMACYEGHTLRDRLTGGPLGLDEAREILRQVALGLAQAHAHGIVHRDVKPSNIFLCHDGQVKLLDFGLARWEGQAAITGAHSTVGTVHYMSPEQARGREADQRSDIWSLGVVLYCMLAGEKPFDGDQVKHVLRAIEREEPRPLADLRPDAPPELVAIVENCLTKSPGKRYQSVADLLADLGEATPVPLTVGGTTLVIPVRRRFPALRTVAAVLALAVVVVVGRGLIDSGPAPSLWLVMSEMEDRTASGDLAPVLHEAMTIDLQQSRHVHVFGGRSLTDALMRMGKVGSPLTNELAAEVAVREGVPLVLESSVRELDGRFVVTVRVVEVGTGEVVCSDTAEAADRRALLASLDALDRRVREQLGESDRAIAQSDEPLEKVTTPSLEALQLYTQGLRAGMDEQAIALLKQAVAADSTFAMAYARLARILLFRANTKASMEYSQRAFDLRHDLTVRERLYIEGEYYRTRAQYAQAAEALVALLELHPEAVDSRYDLITIDMWMFQYHNALAELEKLDPPFKEQRLYVHVRGLLLGGMGRWKEAAANFREAIRRDRGPSLTSRMCLAWSLIGDRSFEAADAQIDTMLALDQDRSVGADYMMAKILPAMGRFDETLTHLEIARLRARSRGDGNQEAWTWIYSGLCLARLGNIAAARLAFREAVALWPGYASYLYLGLECARAGDLSTAIEAEAALAALAEEDPNHLNRTALTHLRGELALQRGDHERAVTLLRDCPLDLDARLALGRAYVAAGDLDAARTQFEFVLSHRFAAFIEGLAATWPLAYYGLGTAAMEAGDKAYGREQLELFLELWGSLDTPVMQDARERLGLVKWPGGRPTD